MKTFCNGQSTVLEGTNVIPSMWLSGQETLKWVFQFGGLSAQYAFKNMHTHSSASHQLVSAQPMKLLHNQHEKIILLGLIWLLLKTSKRPFLSRKCKELSFTMYIIYLQKKAQFLTSSFSKSYHSLLSNIHDRI